MPERLVRPEDFFTEQPPDRIVGIETEYDVRRPSGLADYSWTDKLFTPDILGPMGLVGYVNQNTAWLSNGSFIYPDVGHLEYCTPESLGPAEAIAAAHAGNLLLAQLVSAAGLPIKIFRRSATINPNNGNIVTKGYHVNFCTPDSQCSPSLFMLLESQLATQVYAWGGMVTKNGYCISPKAHDIGNHITTLSQSNRTGQGVKPFGLIRHTSDDSDTNSSQFQLGRFEDRTKTPSTQWSDFMGAATTSLLMRVLENPALKRECKQLRRLVLENSVQTFRHVAQDITLGKLYALADGRQMTALDIQENLSELGAAAVRKLDLPADEIYGALQWQQICNDLRRVETGQDSLAAVADRIGWAGKYVYLAKKLGDVAVMTGDIDALRYCLSWDMVVPRGAGQIFEEKRAPDLLPKRAIQRLVIEPPQGTRAKPRSECIEQGGIGDAEIGFIRWPFISMSEDGNERKRSVVQLHPYQTELPKTIAR